MGIRLPNKQLCVALLQMTVNNRFKMQLSFLNWVAQLPMKMAFILCKCNQTKERMANRMEKLNGSVVDYNLRKLKDRRIPDLRRQLGIVFQDFQLLSDRSVERNLDFVLRATGWKSANKRSDRIVEVLEAVGLADKLKILPHQLSGGEQQRIAIARALLNEPKLILADEPTGNLDPITSEEVMELLHEINGKGTSILMATHDFDLISKFPKRTLMCEDKKVVEVKKKN